MRHFILAGLAAAALAGAPAAAEPGGPDKPKPAARAAAQAATSPTRAEAEAPKPLAEPPKALSADRVGRPVSDRIGEILDDHQARHVAACQARYRSYDPKTDTYQARPGVQRRCRL